MKLFLHHQRMLVVLVVLAFLTALVASHATPWSHWFEYWWMFPIAFTIALTVNTVGVSGAALFVPFFVLIFPLLASPLDAIQSVRLGLITESFGLSSSALAFLAFGLVDLKIARVTIFSAVPLIVVGALLSSFIPEAAFFFMIAGLLVISVVLLRFQKALSTKREREAGKTNVDLSGAQGERVTMVGANGHEYSYCRTPDGYRKRFLGYGIGGFFQGAGGFGIGEMGIVSMMLSDIPIRVAIGTSHLVVASTAILAALIHVGVLLSAHSPMPWNILAMTVPAVALGGQIAPYVAAKLSAKNLERFISILFLVLASALIFVALKKL